MDGPHNPWLPAKYTEKSFGKILRKNPDFFSKFCEIHKFSQHFAMMFPSVWHWYECTANTRDLATITQANLFTALLGIGDTG